MSQNCGNYLNFDVYMDRPMEEAVCWLATTTIYQH